jgi:hypothetical protein
MPKFLIEVTHDPEVVACARVVQVFLMSGSHFLTNADWGCLDGQHSAWMLVEVDNKEEALQIVPPALRSRAEIVQLNKFALEQIDEILRHHRDKSTASPTTTRS